MRTVIFWLPFLAGQSLTIADGVDIVAEKDQHLVVFLEGEEYDEWKASGQVSITKHTLLIGSLVGYSQGPPTPTIDIEWERPFLAYIIRTITAKVHKQMLTPFLIKVSVWLKSDVGLPFCRFALETAMALVPTSAPLKNDYVAATWQEAEQSTVEGQKELLERIVGIYPEIALDELGSDKKSIMSYIYCAALVCLGRNAIASDKERYDKAFRYIADVELIMKITECLIGDGFRMEKCRFLTQ
jgi:hypothetical protein